MTNKNTAILYIINCPKLMGMWESDYIRQREREGLDTDVKFKYATAKRQFKGTIHFFTTRGRLVLETKSSIFLKNDQEARDYLEYLYEKDDWSYEDWT